ncbi:MAG: asparagine synthase (glutamine-hydrolyzing) [Thermoanaerobacter sp.]|jgi:asparagine synthase (glutamine-hydrolysing)|nr:asparagine synthase (glutamine-hydrolyzing) [Thermoanaerobacter sp.]
MCGLAGIIGTADKSKIQRMLEKIQHRGPDESGIFADENITLGHNRLTIIDLYHGRQPIKNEDGRYWLIYNGEIYNYQLLRKDLKNHIFSTDTDSEVIIHLYEELGKNCINYIDGMFALAIYDSKKKTIFIARDPLGIKPLYYGKTKEGYFAFASEIKALQEVTDDINEFPNGYIYTTENGFERYYSIPQDPMHFADVDNIINGLRLRLEDSVRKRLIADVPVGVFLSGGLDSSLIAAIAAKYKNPLHSFAVGVEGSNDLKNARVVADYVGTIHHEFIYTEEDIKKVLPKVIYHLESCDPALVRSAVATYFVSKLASNYVKVILSGEGADELFSGYHYLKNYTNPWKLQSELKYITRNLHNTNLQRVDRMTMAHSIEGRVPFLDIEVLRYAFKITPSFKINGREKTEKWILRKLAENYLPESIVWRRKEKFAIGTGTSEILNKIAESEISDAEYIKNRFLPNGFEIKSKEELYYFKILKRFFNVDSFIKDMGRSRSLNDNQIYA